MLQTITFAGARQINAKARFFKYETGNAGGADESLRVRADGSDLGLFLPGDAVELDGYAALWELTPTTAAATGAVKLGAGRVTSSRIAGNVRIIDDSRSLTAAGQQFVGSWGRVAGAGVFPILGFRAGTRAVSVRRLLLGCTVDTTLTVWTCSGDPTVNAATQAGFGKNLIAAGAQSLTKGIAGDAAAAAPTGVELPGVASFVELRTRANEYREIPLPTPIQLAANLGLAVTANTAASTVFILAAFEEL